jgi:hypothetical protein
MPALGKAGQGAESGERETGPGGSGQGQAELLAQFNYASGDNDPNDGKNNRFDTLFGARRFEFGPTSIYGAFSRCNLISPGIRLQVKPPGRVSGFTGYRVNWLASDRDAWMTANVVDPSGLSGSFLGH